MLADARGRGVVRRAKPERVRLGLLQRRTRGLRVHRQGVRALQGPARGRRARGPGQRQLMATEAGSVGEAWAGPQLDGFKDFYQFVAPTRVIAGRGLIEGLGFEFSKEGAKRVLVITDEGIRATGLIDGVEAGIADGGLAVAGIFDAVPQDSDSAAGMAAAQAAREHGAHAILAVGA